MALSNILPSSKSLLRFLLSTQICMEKVNWRTWATLAHNNSNFKMFSSIYNI